MLHLGDITKINGADVPPVNVVIGGSPCQDLSVAGKRAGLSGERSGLFVEQLRIIKEMRRKDIENGAVITRPRYMVWENVPGAFSSNKGEDFRIVLEETAKVVEPTAAIPRLEKGKWTNAGAIVGDGWSIAWRVFDAQFWGVPQRRRRIALVADFGGATAPEILFERESVSRHTPPSRTPWEDFAAAVAERFGGADNHNAEPGTINVAYSFDSLSSNSMKSKNPYSGCRKINISKTLDTTIPDPSKNQGGIAIVYDARGNGDGETVPTITGDHENRVTDYTALCVRERCGCEGGGKGVLIQNNKSGTLAANNDQFILHPIVCMATQQGGAEIRTDDKSPTLTAAAGMSGNNQPVIAIDRAAFNQGENALYEPKISEDGINSTLTAKGPSAVCAAVDCRNGTENEEINGTLQAKSNGGTSYNLQNVVRISNAVRRLTPLECERLQGFPDGWTDIGDYIDTNGKKRKTSDTARYKALGNSIALPPWAWLLERLSRYSEGDYTMASLFDGIGGFPLIWEALNGEGTCLWASEIDEFPIAVTKRHFS